MKETIVDASVLIKLYIDETGSKSAADEVGKSDKLSAPDLLWPEVGNILWKYVRRNEFDVSVAQQILSDMAQMPIELISTRDLVVQALEIAGENDRSVYDSLYLAAAVQTSATFLTADQRLANSLAKTPLAEFVCAL